MEGRHDQNHNLQCGLPQHQWNGCEQYIETAESFQHVSYAQNSYKYEGDRLPCCYRTSSRRSHFFVGNDGVLYRWKVIGTIGCMLTRDGKEVARCMKKFVTEGMFGGHTKFVLELIDGSETLEMGMLLFTFLLVDHKRHQKQYGHTRTAPENSERGEGADGE